MKTKGKRRNGSKWSDNTCLVNGEQWGIKLVLREIKDGEEIYEVRHIKLKEESPNSDNLTQTLDTKWG